MCSGSLRLPHFGDWMHEGQPDFTHAWFPAAEFDEHVLDGNSAVAPSGDGFAMLKASGQLELIRNGPSADVELRLHGRRGRWIVRVADGAEGGTLNTMRQRFGNLSVTEAGDGALAITDPTYGRVIFAHHGVVEAEGRRLDPSEWTIQGEATTFAA